MTAALFVTGAGGTGKTTVSGALAVAAAAAGTTTLVITVDPAKRLAQALGLDSLGNTPTPVPHTQNLDAAMLDASASWEGLVRRHTDDATADRIVASRFFRAIAERFPAGQAYAAAEETAHIVDSAHYDLVVVDTPPIGGGVHFFSSPEQIRSLVAGRALRILTGPPIPGRRALFGITARPALRLADRILGGPLLEDLAVFLLDLRSAYDGIRRRSHAVQRLLDESPRLVVSTPEPGAVAAARAVIEASADRVAAVALNRTLPLAWADQCPAAATPYEANLARWAAEARRHADMARQFESHGHRPLLLPWTTPAPASVAELGALAHAGGLESLLS